MPPEPPARTISLPCNESANGCLLVTGTRESRVTAREGDQKHRQNLAVSQVHFEESRNHRGDHNRRGSVQEEAVITWSGWKSADAATEVDQRLNQRPQQHQHGRDPSLRGV